MKQLIDELIKKLSVLEGDERIEEINKIKTALHDISPMKNEPVDCVLWVKNDTVVANDYNPNNVAPPEMDLLKISIVSDGYTQPIVAFRETNKYIVVDGFHRNRVGKACKEVTERVKGYLPITIIRSDREDKKDRIAATIRHNRARGVHAIKGMSAVVLELFKRGWSDEKIAAELGMEIDEVLRLKQITGLKEAFANHEFSKTWIDFVKKFEWGE